MQKIEEQRRQKAASHTDDAHCLRSKSVGVFGLGNIGSVLANRIAPQVARVLLVDRDTVEPHNTINQSFEPRHVGLNKVDVIAERIERLAPDVKVERRVADLEDLPLQDFAELDFAVAGLDSLRARQLLSERLYPLRIPYVDGAVGEPLLVRTQVLLPGQACLECSWGPAQYRQLAYEYPCFSGAAAGRTTVQASAGAAAAAAIVAQCMKVFGSDPPRESYEVNGDLLAGRFITARRRRNPRCRFSHEVVSQLIRLEKPFAEATITSLLSAVDRSFRKQVVQLEFRRGIVKDDLFGASRFASPQQLNRISHLRLAELGLTPKDRIVVRASGQTRVAHVCLDTSDSVALSGEDPS